MSNLSDVMNQKVCTPDSIPVDWSWKSLVDVCRPKQWKTISASEMTISGFPVFGANGYVGFYSEYNHEFESITITCRGNTCGTVNRVPAMTYITGNSMALDNVLENKIIQDFLYYALCYRSVSDSISGSAQPQITGNNLRHIRLPTPSLAEQQKIAKILTSVDDVIEKTQAQIDKLKDLKTGMMQELLTKGIGHTEFKDSPVGRIPVEWEVIQVNKVANVVDSMHQTPSFSEYGMPMVRVTEIRQGEALDICGAVQVDVETFSSFSKNYQPKQGDTLIARVGAYFGSTAFISEDHEFCLGQNTASIRPEKVHPQFLFDCLNSEEGRAQMNDVVAVGAQPSLSLKAIKEHKIPLPSENEQRLISNAINSVRKKISVISVKLYQLKDTKKALMQDLLTGKVRVAV